MVRALFWHLPLFAASPIDSLAGAQGEEGMNFYIVVEGAPIVTVLAGDGSIEVERRLGPGDTFGEVALLANTPRSASVKAGPEQVCAFHGCCAGAHP